MTFNRLEINGEEIPEGQQVRFIPDYSNWWTRPAEGTSYVFAALFIALAVCLGILVVGLL